MSAMPGVRVRGLAAPQQCPLCGYRFDKPVEVCCACPLHERCRVESCPHCGYQFVTHSSLVALLQRLAARGSRARERKAGAPEGSPRASIERRRP